MKMTFVFALGFIICISFATFINVPSNLGYSIYITPPATNITNFKLIGKRLKISMNSSSTIQIEYNNIGSILRFLNKNYPVLQKKVLLKIYAKKAITFIDNTFKNKEFLVKTGWYYCIYKNIYYIFQVKDSKSIEIPIPKYNLQLQCRPQAKIFLTKKFIGITPISTTLFMDTYTLQIIPIEEGYERLTKTIDLNNNIKLNVYLKKLNEVQIETNTKKFKILINGKRVKNKFYLENGKYLLTIEATGFYTLNKSIEINSNKINLYYQLKPKIFSLNIETTREAKIYVDSVFISEGKINISLPAGEHRISIKLQGYTPFEKTINLQDNIAIKQLLSPLPGTIIQSFNIKNAKFAIYTNGTLQIITENNLFKISKTINIEKNQEYSFIYSNMLVSRSGKITLNGKNFYVEPFILSIIRYSSFYLIITTSGNIYSFNGYTQPVLIKTLSSNYSYIKSVIYKNNIFILSSNGKIYDVDIRRGSKKCIVNKKFIKDFDVYKDKIYAISNDKIYIYKDNRELSHKTGSFNYIYKSLVYGKYVYDLAKNKKLNNCSLKSLNSSIYYWNNTIYYPDKNSKYPIDEKPVKILKYGEYLVLIMKDKVEVMKL